MATQSTLLELAEAQRQLALIQAKKAAEDASESALATAMASVQGTLRVKRLAIALHGLLCAKTHDQGAQCPFKTETADWDDAAEADWSTTEHALWLARARSGIKAMRDLGFTVTDPA